MPSAARFGDAVGGIGQWDGHGFTNEDDRLIWCEPHMDLRGQTEAAILDESTGEWVPFTLNLEDPEELAAFLRGEIPKAPTALTDSSNGIHSVSPRFPVRTAPTLVHATPTAYIIPGAGGHHRRSIRLRQSTTPHLCCLRSVLARSPQLGPAA